MTRTIDASTVSELSNDALRLAKLVQMDFSTAVRITDYGRDVTALSQTWDASGHFLTMSEAVETTDLRVNALRLQLSGVEQTYVSLFLSNDYIDVRLRVWYAFLDSSDTVVGAPILVFDGRIGEFGIAENEDSVVVEVSAASHWANFDMVNGRKTNHNSQQVAFSGDDGFEYASDTVKEIKWGRG